MLNLVHKTIDHFIRSRNGPDVNTRKYITAIINTLNHQRETYPELQRYTSKLAELANDLDRPQLEEYVNQICNYLSQPKSIAELNEIIDTGLTSQMSLGEVIQPFEPMTAVAPGSSQIKSLYIKRQEIPIYFNSERLSNLLEIFIERTEAKFTIDESGNVYLSEGPCITVSSEGLSTKPSLSLQIFQIVIERGMVFKIGDMYIEIDYDSHSIGLWVANKQSIMKSYEFSIREVVTIGSSLSSLVILDNLYVSRNHCSISMNSNGELIFNDQNSLNGSFVMLHTQTSLINETSSIQWRMRHQDVFCISEERVRLVIS